VTTPGTTARGVTARVLDAFVDRVVVYDRVTPNPDLDGLDEATRELGERRYAGVIAVGGGSAIDTAKVLSVTLTSGRERPLHRALRDGTGQEWGTKVPTFAVPTTAGTGAEVTPFATVWDHTTRTKYSVAAPLVSPEYAILDPRLSVSLSAEQTLYPALDTTSHALESLWNVNRTPVSAMFAFEALGLVLGGLRPVLADPTREASRGDLLLASLLAG
jgi:alcohol dehydrogenase